MARLEQPRGMTSIEIIAFSLPERPFIPVQLDPTHTIENGLNRFVSGTALIGVFNPENKDPVLLPGKQPVEQRRPHPADMEEARRTGRKPNPDLTHHVTVVERGRMNGGHL
jgi:hypothetical protein